MFYRASKQSQIVKPQYSSPTLTRSGGPACSGSLMEGGMSEVRLRLHHAMPQFTMLFFRTDMSCKSGHVFFRVCGSIKISPNQCQSIDESIP